MREFKIMKAHLDRDERALAEEAGLPDTIPFSVVSPFERRAKKNHGQTLKRLSERGGLDPYELVTLFEDRPLFGKDAQHMNGLEAITRLALLLKVRMDGGL
ncbi:MAG: hypothetical protein GY906_08625 [bacterium]|nr:hypothetical protein [bacterium]